VLGARIVSVFQTIQRQNQVKARDGAEFMDAAAQKGAIHFNEYGSAAIDDLARQVADTRVLQRRIATDPHYGS
jgi:hypothetical protein